MKMGFLCRVPDRIKGQSATGRGRLRRRIGRGRAGVRSCGSAVGRSAGRSGERRCDHHLQQSPVRLRRGRRRSGRLPVDDHHGGLLHAGRQHHDLRDFDHCPRRPADAVSPGDPTTGTPVVPATVDVRGNVFVGSGGVFLFGCSPNISCSNPPGISFDRIGGNLTAIGAQGVVVHSASVGGSVLLEGGGGSSAADTCNAQVPDTPTVANLEPWSDDANLDYTPIYCDFEDTSIGGDLTITGLDSCWLGTLRDQVGGSATFTDNSMGDPDAMEVDNNLIQGDMTCYGNVPEVQFGDGGAAPNIVGGYAVDECGFSSTRPSIPPQRQGREPASLSTSPSPAEPDDLPRSLVVDPCSVASVCDHELRRHDHCPDLQLRLLWSPGLSGSGTYDPTEPPGQSGAAVLETVYPDGSESFTAFLSCNCSLGETGQSGSVAIRAYGTTSPDGVTNGTFLVTSGGSIATGSLSTPGYGTFSNIAALPGSELLTENLAIT